MTTIEDIAAFFRPGGVLSKKHPGYEFRPEQVQMAAAVAAAVGRKEILLVEAGTGVGKSLAYLYPLILWTRALKKKVAVSTETKTLQKQLIEKDIPFLVSALGVTLQAELCLGANNYLCLLRLERSGQRELFESKQSAKQYQAILSWSRETDRGLLLELDFVPRGEVWSSIQVEPDMCLRRKCPRFEACFYYHARERAEAADLLVMNHHLFFANLAVGGAALPPFEAVVFDEAHSLEEAATSFLGAEVSQYRAPSLLNHLFSLKTGKGFLPAHLKDAFQAQSWEGRFREVHDLNEDFFARLEETWKGKKTVRIRDRIQADELTRSLINLIDQLKEAKKAIPDEESREECGGYLVRAGELVSDLDAISNLKNEDWVYWFERSGERRRVRRALHMAPIKVGDYLQEKVWGQYSPVILTSATLSTGGNFGYLRGRLGLEGGNELILASPFDYLRRVVVYTDPKIPDPKSRLDEYEERVIEDIEKIVQATEGGAFVLFTSYRMLDKAYETLAPKFSRYRLFRQGEGERYKILEEFKSRSDSVLFGTTSFWQGVDVPGANLRCVIIAKLPFGVPDEPVLQARLEYIREMEGDPFNDFQLPEAIIMLRQGFGRLIRHRQDYGVVAILDPRVRTRGYGRAFFSSLPPCRSTSDLDEVSAFMKTMRTTNPANSTE
ncbi:MAG: ATP-dependent DNA helicase [Candidatus Aureabacteria bacterium]|nr:ATP-dependent DNA helicase [Candidatus Auribacterota bacterium]